MAKWYVVLRGGKPVRSRRKGRYAGSRGDKIFGRLDCPSGLRKLHAKNRVFFLTWEDAVGSGYRPCMVCRPERPQRGKKKKRLSGTRR